MTQENLGQSPILPPVRAPSNQLLSSLDDQKFLRNLGKRLRDQRESRGLTQAQLAEKCNLHRTFVGSVERGERNVSILNLRLLARMLRVPLGVLLE